MLEITLIQLANYLPSDLKGTIQLEQLAYILSDAHDFLLEVTEAIPPHVIPAMFVTQELPRDSGLRHFQKENVRHAFFHVRLSEVEMTDLASALRAAGDRGVKLSPDLLSLLARYVQYFKRKDAAKYVECSVDNCLKVAEFRRAWYPIRDTERALREDLETGALYWFGRDRNYHPGLFCHLRKLSALPAPRMLRLMLFVFEWGRQFMLVPRWSESCSILCEARGVSLNQIPRQAIHDLLPLFTEHFPFHMERVHTVYDSIILDVLWHISKAFLTDIQKEKICMYSASHIPELLQFYHPSQLLTSLGGQRKEPRRFYPFPVQMPPYRDKENVRVHQVRHQKDNVIPGAYRCFDQTTMRGLLQVSPSKSACPLLFHPRRTMEFCHRRNLPVPRLVRQEVTWSMWKEVGVLRVSPGPKSFIFPVVIGTPQNERTTEEKNLQTLSTLDASSDHCTMLGKLRS